MVAAYDGIVVSVNAMAGTARVKPGDCVTAGQVLIAGEERLSAEKREVCARWEKLWLARGAKEPLRRNCT